MKTRNKELLGRVKELLKRVPVVQSLLNLKSKFINKKNRMREFSWLIKEKRIIVFPSYFGIETDIASTHEMVHELVKEWLDNHGVTLLGRTSATTLNYPAGSTLLYEPQALVKIPSTHEEYLKKVERETRREIKLAERQGYEFREFVWNDHLDEIYEINTSKEMRQSLPMLWWYKHPVQPRFHKKEEQPFKKYYGAFKDGILCAYLHFWICGDWAVLKHIIGHADYLKFGIMNGLIYFTVRECIENSQIRWLHYGGNGLKGSLGSFKKRAGFEEYAILLDLKGDLELLKYSKRKVKTLWRI